MYRGVLRGRSGVKGVEGRALCFCGERIAAGREDG